MGLMSEGWGYVKRVLLGGRYFFGLWSVVPAHMCISLLSHDRGVSMPEAKVRLGSERIACVIIFSIPCLPSMRLFAYGCLGLRSCMMLPEGKILQARKMPTSACGSLR